MFKLVVATLATVLVAPALVACGTQDASSVVDALLAEGLGAQPPYTAVAGESGPSSFAGCPGLSFELTSSGEDWYGRAFVCDTRTHFDIMVGDYGNLETGTDGPRGRPWVFINERTNTLLELDGDLPENIAAEYERVIAELP